MAVVSAGMAAPEMWLDAVEGSGSEGVLPDADWPWPWGPLGLNPWLTLAMAVISFASEGLCKLSPALQQSAIIVCALRLSPCAAPGSLRWRDIIRSGHHFQRGVAAVLHARFE